jgi:hypothetical protein
MAEDVDLRITVSLDSGAPDPMVVRHPCRCDAPDPESTRWEPLAVPLGSLREAGRSIVICPECDFRILVVDGGRGEPRIGRPGRMLPEIESAVCRARTAQRGCISETSPQDAPS